MALGPPRFESGRQFQRNRARDFGVNVRGININPEFYSGVIKSF